MLPSGFRGSDEEGVCRRDDLLCTRVEGVAVVPRVPVGRAHHTLDMPAGDVFRAVRVHLIGLDEQSGTGRDGDTVDPHAAPGLRLHGDHADPVGFSGQHLVQGIAGDGQRIDGDLLIGDVHETGRAGDQAGPYPAGVVGRGEHDHRLIGQEFGGGVRDLVADHPAQTCGDLALAQSGAAPPARPGDRRSWRAFRRIRRWVIRRWGPARPRRRVARRPRAGSRRGR